MIRFSSQLSQNDYVRASLIVLYRKPLVSIVSFLLGVLLIVNVGLLVAGYKITPDLIALPVVLLFITPFSTYLTARRTFRANITAGAQLEYTFDDKQLTVSAGNSYNRAEISGLKKVFKTSGWLFLVNASGNVSPIPARDVTDEQLAELKAILNANGVRNNL